MFGTKKLKEELNIKDKKIKELQENLAESITNNYFVIGEVSKYTEDDLEKIKSNPDSVKAIINYLKYQIAIKTDLIRNNRDKISLDQKIGYVNALHEVYIFFHNFTKEEKKKEEYSGQNLI